VLLCAESMACRRISRRARRGRDAAWAPCLALYAYKLAYLPGSKYPRSSVFVSAAHATGSTCANTDGSRLLATSFNARDTIDMADSVNSTGNFAS